MTDAPGRVLVTDFDGTVTGQDFYNLFLTRHYPPDGPDYWAMCLDGQISHFDCLRNVYAAAAPGETALLEIVANLAPPTDFAERVADLRRHGWHLEVASAGCRWYIDRLFARVGVDVPVHANNGTVTAGRLVMELNLESPYFHPLAGIDKEAVVIGLQTQGCEVAFAGDGITDLAAARRVPPHRRFAKASLAEHLRRADEPFIPFESWSEVARRLVADG